MGHLDRLTNISTFTTRGIPLLAPGYDPITSSGSIPESTVAIPSLNTQLIVLDPEWHRTKLNAFGFDFSELITEPLEIDPNFAVSRVFGIYADGSFALNLFLEIVRKSSNVTIIMAHGHHLNGGLEWAVAYRESDKIHLIDINEYLLKLDIDPRSSCIILDVCNPRSISLKQDTVNRIGKPIFYLLGNSSTYDERHLQVAIPINPNLLNSSN